MDIPHYSIGIDYGTNSVRALVVDTRTGQEVGCGVWAYLRGDQGVILDARQPDLARQHPQDYLDGLCAAVRAALKQARHHAAFDASRVVGIGVDTTGSTPIPVDCDGKPLALQRKWADRPDAMAWLWKDHTSHAEAAEITQLAQRDKPEYLAKCGGIYSSEWFWSKLLHCQRVAPRVFDAAASWVELADYIPAVLTGTTALNQLKRGVCAAGHKAFYHPDWGGYPDPAFLERLDPVLVRIRQTLPDRAYTIGDAAGTLTAAWSKSLGLPAGIPVAVGAFDAHLGAVGSGIKTGTLVKIIGTSACDIAVAPLAKPLPDIPGLCGIVPESVLPDAFGLEAGQAAVGDIFNWFVQHIQPGGPKTGTHENLNGQATKLKPGQSGLLALDWWNGNRTVLVDQRLTGLILGLTLHSTPAEIYRALIEATAFGARAIVNRLESHGVAIKRVVNCGGIAAKSPLTMQIYADVLNRPVTLSRSAQTCALGAAMAGAVVAGRAAGGHDTFTQAARAMTAVLPKRFTPRRAAVRVYEKLYACYQQLHDAFGVSGSADLSPIMKELLSLRDEVRS